MFASPYTIRIHSVNERLLLREITELSKESSESLVSSTSFTEAESKQKISYIAFQTASGTRCREAGQPDLGAVWRRGQMRSCYGVSRRRYGRCVGELNKRYETRSKPKLSNR